MKNLKDIISEKLTINKGAKFNKYNYQPKDRKELQNLVKKLVHERGNDADLNDIDTSEITDMSNLFANLDLKNFDGNISKWDVSNVKDMSMMFRYTKFSGENSDLSKWDVSNVGDMHGMFEGCPFNGDLSKWNVSNINNIAAMFKDSKFDGDINN